MVTVSPPSSRPESLFKTLIITGVFSFVEVLSSTAIGKLLQLIIFTLNESSSVQPLRVAVTV